MGSGMPEIGSRISLISKADIRYEGKLFSVDPDECTIALSSVRSYGTEDRKTPYPVPAQHQVYEFILFRGSDIKDIRVLTTTIPNDPAIVQLSVPPSLSNVENQFEPSDSDFRVSNTAGSSNRMPNAPGASSRTSQTFQNSGFKSTSVLSHIDQVMNKHSAQIAPSEDESRSSTPSAQNAKNSDAPARTSVSSNKSDDQSLQQQRKQQTYDGNRDMNRSQQQYQNRYQQGNKPQYQQRYQQNRYSQQQQHQQQQPNQRYQQQSQYRDYNNRDYNNREYNNRDYNNRDYNNRDYNNRDNQYRNYNNDYRDGYGQRQYMQPLRGNVQRSDNWNSYNQRRMNRPGQGVGNQNNYQSTGGYQNQNRRPRNTLKFDEEYDFEQANSQFEEMRSQLSKVKIDDAGSPKVNGEADVSKKEDSGNEVSGGEENDHEAETKEQCYDKVKSFFDQISYEAIERSKGLTARVDWKTERKINSETFGQVALRRNANNYRRRVNNNGGNGGNGYYNYQNNRNAAMQNNYRSGGYNNNRLQLQGNRPPRRQYNNPTSDHEESKENQVTT